MAHPGRERVWVKLSYLTPLQSYNRTLGSLDSSCHRVFNRDTFSKPIGARPVQLATRVDGDDCASAIQRL